MHSEIHVPINELLPEYALGTLDVSEADMVRRHLESCAACRQELVSYESVVDALPLAAPTMDPPTHLRTAVLERVGELPATETAESPWWHTLRVRLQDFLAGPRWQPALVLAVFAVLVGALYFWQQANRAQPEQYELTATEAAPGAHGVIEVAANGRDATLVVNGLPTLSPQEQYQLWLIVDGQRASGAVFSVAADGTASVPVDSLRPLSEFGAFGITIEPAGGSPGPTGQRVLGHNL
ncbi:MAG: anti-sigma factor domain-containing protein [Candidatus Promineifilaceae bacterium]